MILRILKEFDTDESYEFSKSNITIGRDNNCDIIILDESSYGELSQIRKYLDHDIPNPY